MARFANLTDQQVRDLGAYIQASFNGLDAQALMGFADAIVGMINQRAEKATAAHTAASGFSAMTGTASKGVVATGTATAAQVAEQVKAIKDALIAQGILRS